MLTKEDTQEAKELWNLQIKETDTGFLPFVRTRKYRAVIDLENTNKLQTVFLNTGPLNLIEHPYWTMIFKVKDFYENEKTKDQKACIRNFEWIFAKPFKDEINDAETKTK